MVPESLSANMALSVVNVVRRNLPAQCMAVGSLLLPRTNEVVQTRGRKNNKHWDPRWRKERREKVLKMELPEFNTKDDMDLASRRAEMKKKGMLPPVEFEERNISIAATRAIFEPYVPPEGDGKSSILTAQGAKETAKHFAKGGTSWRATRKIRKVEEDGGSTFNVKEFAAQAFDIYKKASTLLNDVTKNERELHELVTEKAYPEMVHMLEKKTVRWAFVESLEPPRVVQARQTYLIQKENTYAQITCRFYTRQILAIYDRFGRLMLGSEVTPRDCLEYVVFEKHLVDVEGRWRVHGKIHPDWAPAGAAPQRTVRQPPGTTHAAARPTDPHPRHPGPAGGASRPGHPGAGVTW